MKKSLKKVESGIKKTGDYVVNNKKTILYGAGIILALYLGYKIYKGINLFDLNPPIDDEVDDVGSNLVVSNATITEAEARNYAQQLLDAMNQNDCWVCYGTDEEAIYNVFKKIQNKDDFLLIFKAFGRKDYNGFNSPPKGISKNLDVYEPRNLVYWLKSEISVLDGLVYQLVKQTVESAGFSF